MNYETNAVSLPELRWLGSHSASCFHTADAIRRGWPLADVALADVLQTPVERLVQTVRAMGLDETRFWSHLVPLSADIQNNTRLAGTILRKLSATTDPTPTLVGRLAGRISDVEAAVRLALPSLVDRLSIEAEPLVQQWSDSGPRLLDGIARHTDPQFMVPNAAVIVVHAALGGAGVAHLPYNTVRIEPVDPHTDPHLPEVVRLAWLLAQLNVDLPMFSELIHCDRVAQVAGLAMLPAALAAGREMRLCDDDPATVRLALESWRVEGPSETDLTEVVTRWWSSHLELRPAWNVSLAALDRMIVATQ